MSEKGILKKIDDIFNYCEEIDNHLPKEEQTGYRMLPDIFYIKKEVNNLQQKVEQLEKELQITVNNCKQLENIRKEAIEYINSYKNDYAPYELSDYNVREILNILNKGDNNGK